MWNKEGKKVKHILSGHSGYIVTGESVNLTDTNGIHLAEINFWNSDTKCFYNLVCCREELVIDVNPGQ
uniref:Uncharacterized protein n=1 Tax=viral metagenome TaxID=1070528 RepID=A0A6M3JBY3_9ZZZZ